MLRDDRLPAYSRSGMKTIGALTITATWMLSLAAFAQPSTPESSGSAGGDASDEVEEIVVRGQAGQGVETDAAVSVTAFGAADLAALGVEDVADLAQFTPNLEIPKFGSTTVSFFIRGVGLNDFTPAASTSVAVYYDDVSLNLPQFSLAKTFDVEQVDVLKGPIGAGPGRNASAGAIKIYSRKPTGDFSAFVRSEYTIGSFNADDTEGAVEFPIVPDQLSARLSFRVSHQDPYVSNGCGNAPEPGLDRVADLSQPGNSAVCNEPLNLWPSPIPDPFASPTLGSPGPEINNFIVYPNANAPNPDPAGPQYWTPRNYHGGDPSFSDAPYRISYLPPGLEGMVNDADSWAARGIFRYQPTELDMDWQLIAHGGRVDELTPMGQAIPTGGSTFGNGVRGYVPEEIAQQYNELFAHFTDLGVESPGDDAQNALANSLARNLDRRPYHGDYNLIGRTTVDSYGTSLRGDWQLDSASITSISSYEFYEVDQVQDFDFMPIVLLENFLNHEAWQFVQSIDFQDELDDVPFRYGIGAYYLMDHLEYEQDQVTGAPGIEPRFRPYTQETWSFNVGMTFSWEFLDDFTLEGGARYNWERKRMDVTGFELGETQVCRPPPLDLVDCVQQYTYDAPTGELTLRYHFNEDISSYVKYTHGWKGAQLNAGTAKSLADEPISAADPETIDAFEIGMHGEWWDGRIALDLALFHYTYSDYQVFIIQNDFGSIPQRVVINADDAIYYGAEANLQVSPIENLNLIGRFGWNESEFLDFTRQQVYAIPQPGNNPPEALQINLVYTGNQLPNAPQFKVSGTADYTLELGRFGSLIPRYDVSWTDDVYFDPSEGRGDPGANGEFLFPEFAIGQPSYVLHSVRLTWRSASGNLELAGWARNLTDEVYKVYAFNAQAIGFVGNFVGQPRTYGVSMLLSW